MVSEQGSRHCSCQGSAKERGHTLVNRRNKSSGLHLFPQLPHGRPASTLPALPAVPQGSTWEEEDTPRMAPLGIASIPHTCLLSEACSSPNTGRSPQNSDGHKKAAESFAQPQSPQPHEQCCPLPVLAPSTPQNAQTLISHLQITWTTLPRAKLDKCWPARPAICRGGIGLHLAPVGQ